MIAAIVKTTYLPDLTSYDDYTWTTVDLTIWVALEEYLIILAANIPSLTPLFNIIVHSRSSRSKRSKSTPIEVEGNPTSRSRKPSRAGFFRRSPSVPPGQSQNHITSYAQNSNSQSQYQSYLPFASVGRDYVEYPLTWTSKPDAQSEEGESRSGSGSESEVPIHAFSEPHSPRGILRTTEFRIKEVSTAPPYQEG